MELIVGVVIIATVSFIIELFVQDRKNKDELANRRTEYDGTLDWDSMWN
jgi:hypothetical protein